MTTTTAAQTGTFEGKTAAEWRALSVRSHEARNESWDRCDTDGFLSQWAHGLTATENEYRAQLAETDGKCDVQAAFDLDGNLLRALHGWSDYGEYFMIKDADGNKIEFFSPSQARSETTARRNNAKKGYYVGTVRVPATVKIMGGGTGLAGAANCYAMIVPASKEIIPSADVEIVDNGQ